MIAISNLFCANILQNSFSRRIDTSFAKQKMTENANRYYFNTRNKSGITELMANPFIHNLNKVVNNKMQFKNKN